MQETLIPYGDLLRFIDRFKYDGQKVFEVWQKGKKVDTEEINPKSFETFQIVYLANPFRPPLEELGKHSTIVAYASNNTLFSSIYWKEDWFDSFVDEPYESLERKLKILNQKLYGEKKEHEIQLKLKEFFGYDKKKNIWLYFDKGTRPLINKTIKDSIFATQFAIAIIEKSEKEIYEIKNVFHDILSKHYDKKINLTKSNIDEFNKMYTECENIWKE